MERREGVAREFDGFKSLRLLIQSYMGMKRKVRSGNGRGAERVLAEEVQAPRGWQRGMYLDGTSRGESAASAACWMCNFSTSLSLSLFFL